MKPIPAIVERHMAAVDHLAEIIIVALAGERDAGNTAARHEQLGAAARETQKLRRLEIGRALLKARGAFPARGPAPNGAPNWADFLARVKLDDSTATRYMNEAKTGGVHGERPDATNRSTAHVSQTPSEADVLALAAKLDPDARGRIQRSLRSLQARENEGDRDAYCTPAEITALLPAVDLDPCSNPRSTVRARQSWQLERGENGLEVSWTGSGFWNVPYSKPLPWAEKFDRDRSAITSAGWLVNADHSPAWWHLLTKTLTIRLDFDERLEFAPPPGVEASKNDRPQTLLMDEAFWTECNQAELLKLGKLWRQHTPNT